MTKTQDHPLVPFKSTNISLIDKRIDKMLAKTRNHYESEPVGEEFETLVQDMYTCFPLTVRFDAFYASMLCHAGQRMTPKHIRNIAWRLAGNMTQLKKGTPVPPWTRQTKLEWVPVWITRATPARSPKGIPGFVFEYLALAGTPAGQKFEVFRSSRFASHLARFLGFQRRRNSPFRFSDGAELVRMRMYVLFDPKLERDGQPGWFNFVVTPSFLAYNKRILKRRFRITPCPLGLSRAELPCHRCPAGYTPAASKPGKLLPEGCYAACHPLEYFERSCPRCLRPKALFDPLQYSSAICVDCMNNERRGYANKSESTKAVDV